MNEIISIDPITAFFTALIKCGAQVQSQRIESEERSEARRLRLKALEAEFDFRADLARIQAGTIKDLVHSLIDLRVNAVQAGFVAILEMYAEQARHYMHECGEYAIADRKATTHADQVRFTISIDRSNRELKRIRAAALSLYRDMNSTILSIGGTELPIHFGLQQALMLGA